jgi:hypothetical protein
VRWDDDADDGMKNSVLSRKPEIRIALAGLLTWLLPGAGHLLIGERSRGLIFMIAIGATYWGGIAVGGVENTISIQERRLWFIGQICAGGHALVTLAWDEALHSEPGENRAYGRAEEVAVVYTAICGMLNVLVIFDVLVRAERTGMPGGVSAGPLPRAGPARGKA